MGCNSPGATHHRACDCREREWAERLAASEKAREEADAYAGRANARIADLGERLDATEAVLRDAEKARKEAEGRRDEIATDMARWNQRAIAAETRAARLQEALDAVGRLLATSPKKPIDRIVDALRITQTTRAAIAAEEGK